MNADTQSARELLLCQSDETSKGDDVLASLKTAPPPGLPSPTSGVEVDGTPLPGPRNAAYTSYALIAKVFEVDPRRCPCGGTMRVVGVILDPKVIRKILQHRPRIETRAHAPPAG